MQKFRMKSCLFHHKVMCTVFLSMIMIVDVKSAFYSFISYTLQDYWYHLLMVHVS